MLTLSILPLKTASVSLSIEPRFHHGYYIKNLIEFPAGILQGVFFNNDRPKYMNYGAIGFVIGHEITHGFDDQGRQFDKNGNLVDWWAPETQKAFVQKAQCIIDQYGNYTVPEIGINVSATFNFHGTVNTDFFKLFFTYVRRFVCMSLRFVLKAGFACKKVVRLRLYGGMNIRDV